MRLNFSVSGLERIVAEIERRASAFRVEAGDVMEANGLGMMEQTAEVSPFDTGFMASHVQYTPEPDRLAFTVGWHRMDFEAEGFEPYYFYQEFGTERHGAQPSLGPTAHQSLPEVPADMAAAMRRTMVEGR